MVERPPSRLIIEPVIQLFSSMINCFAILTTDSGVPIRPRLCIFFDISRDMGLEIMLEDIDIEITVKEK